MLTTAKTFTNLNHFVKFSCHFEVSRITFRAVLSKTP